MYVFCFLLIVADVVFLAKRIIFFIVTIHLVVVSFCHLLPWVARPRKNKQRPQSHSSLWVTHSTTASPQQYTIKKQQAWSHSIIALIQSYIVFIIFFYEVRVPKQQFRYNTLAAILIPIQPVGAFCNIFLMRCAFHLLVSIRFLFLTIWWSCV